MWKKPSLIVDKLKVKHNIEKMYHKADTNHIAFRPHFKTHQSVEIGKLFKERGITKITVSSVTMAQFFANEGWNDITIAFPVNLLEIDKVNNLASEIELNLLVESLYSTQFLAEQLRYATGIFIKIDTGYQRTGINPKNTTRIDEIINIINTTDKLHFKGFLTHSGHTYAANSTSEIKEIYYDSVKQLSELKSKYINDFPEIIISYGDTPSCSIIEEFSVIDEIRPGNFVYYDVMQSNIGSCKIEEIAVTVACPVVAIHPERDELVIYGGAAHLSKEFIIDKNGNKNYGLVVKINEKAWSEPILKAYVSSLSQEHGIITIHTKELSNFKPGDLIGVLPIHSCLTADLLKDDTYLIN